MLILLKTLPFKNVLMKQLINQAILFLSIKVKNINLLLALLMTEGEEVAHYFLPAGSYLSVE